MATTLFLVRHAVHDLIGRVLTGRMAGISLGEEGRRQCERLTARLSRERVAAIYASPLERAQETAAPIAARLGLRVETVDDATDVDYGEWSGSAFDDLDRDERWPAWNHSKATGRPPGGETLLEVQLRAVRTTERIVAANPDGAAVLVSHGDVIKSVIAWCLGLAVEHIDRIEIGPASVSTVVIAPWGARVHALNEAATA